LTAIFWVRCFFELMSLLTAGVGGRCANVHETIVLVADSHFFAGEDVATEIQNKRLPLLFFLTAGVAYYSPIKCSRAGASINQCHRRLQPL